MKTALVVLTLTLSLPSPAAQVTETFSSRDNYDAGAAGADEAVWNQALGKVHRTLQVTNYLDPAPTPAPDPIDLNVGNGSDGAFDISTYASFSQGGDVSGNVIRLSNPSLNVTSFVLESGWTLRPVVGSGPLVIRSLSDVIVRGTIDCSGEAGTAATDAVPGSGGSARCGGHAGGGGGSPGQNGQDGFDATAPVTGGSGGDFNAGFAVGGGGGGAWNNSAAGNGGNSSLSGGGAGSNSNDPVFATVDGGAGGGGGSGSLTAAGGGGGGGGGVVVIHAARDFELGASPSSATGLILASGGSGGNASDTGLNPGGGGGGGGGGSVQVFSGGAIRIYNTTQAGASRASGGPIGTNGTVAGGTGATGRSWFTSATYFRSTDDDGAGPNVDAFYVPSEDIAINVGDHVQFANASQSVITKSFDLISSLPTLSAATISPPSPDFTVEYAGSSDNFGADTTGWTTDLSRVQGKRYLKLKLTIASTAAAMMDSATFNYQAGVLEDFTFKTAGCGRVGNSRGPMMATWPFFGALLLFLISLRRRARRNVN